MTQAEPAGGPALPAPRDVGPRFTVRRDGFSELELARAVAAASSRGAHSFTPDQAFAALRRELARGDANGPAALRIGAAMFTAALTVVSVALLLGRALAPALLLAPLLLLGLTALAIRSARRAFRRLPERASFRAALRAWSEGRHDVRLLDGGGRLEREPGSQYRSAPRRASTLPSPPALGPPAVLVAARDELVDVLIDNGIHRELDVIVVSARGYPSHHLEAARARLASDSTCPIVHLPARAGDRDELRARLDALGLDARDWPHELPYPALREHVREALRRARLRPAALTTTR